MRYEWKKITRSAVLLMLGVILLNGWMFYRHCHDSFDGYTLMQIQEAFSWSEEAMDEKDEELGGQILVFDANSPTGLTRQSLSKAVLARRSFDYADHLKRIEADADFRIRSGLFGDADSFSERSMVRIKEIYQKLSGLQVKPAFSGTLEVFDGWHISDLFFLFFGCIPGLFLLIQERRSGLMMLLRPTKKGHSALYLRKFAVVAFTILLGFLLIYGTDLAIAVHLFGLGDLSRPIQSAYGFQNCPIPLTVIGYLLSFFAAKLLWGCAVCVLFFTICSVLPSISGVLLTATAILAAALGMGASDSLWLRTFSLSYLAGTEKLYQQCVLLNFFGKPVRQMPMSLCFCAAVLLASFFIGWVSFVRRSAIPASKSTGALCLHPLHRHACLFLHEGQKLLWLHGGLLLLLVLTAVQCFSYRNFDSPKSQRDFYYRQYSTQLSGAPSAASDQLIADERERFAEIHKRIDSYYAAVGDEADAALLTAGLQDELRAEEAFQDAAAQYEALQPGQSYVDRTGYERLYGPTGPKEDQLNLIKWLLFLILTFSGVFAVERETGMDVLQTTAGAKRRIARCKIIWCGGTLFVSFWSAYLPRYLMVLKHYGLPEMNAAANSLTLFSGFSNFWSIRGVLLLAGVIHLLLGTAATTLILLFSRKSSNKTTAILLGLGVLVLPAVLAWMLL